MAENSKIEWTHHTFNPWIGCQKVGPGCDHCYAEAWDARGLQQRESRWGPHADRTRTSAGNWSKPRAWNKAAAGLAERPRVFCASLADVFDNHTSILPEWRADLWALIRATPNLDWLLLTKRPGNIAKMLPPDWGDGYPNVWLGCTVVNQDEADRDVPKLLAVPARVRFLSMEPLLGPVDLTELKNPAVTIGEHIYSALDCDVDPEDDEWHGAKIHLVIVGGESGPGARPMHPDWARSLRDQCQSAGVAFFFKQWGEWAPGENVPDEITGWRADATFGPWGCGADWCYSETDMGDPESNWDDEADLFRVGKKAAGRLLDGRTWDQLPGAK